MAPHAPLEIVAVAITLFSLAVDLARMGTVPLARYFGIDAWWTFGPVAAP